MAPTGGGAALRPATDDDGRFLEELYASTRREEVAGWGWSEAQQDVFLHMQHAAQRQGYRARFPRADDRIIEVEGRPAGRLLVDRAEHELRLVDVALLPEFRGRGIGGRLLQSLLGEAQRADKPVRLQVLAQSRARRLYLRLGFRPVAEQTPYVEMEWSARLPDGAPR